MDRRTFITALIAVSLVPAAVVASNPKLARLEAQLRAQFGEDTDEILGTARRCCAEAIGNHHDLDPHDEDNLETLTDIALENAVKELSAKGLWDAPALELS